MSAVPPDHERVQVGPWVIARLPGGSVWIMHVDGEAMEVDLPEFEKWIEQFWKERF
jgi:hypothetical protein